MAKNRLLNQQYLARLPADFDATINSDKEWIIYWCLQVTYEKMRKKHTWIKSPDINRQYRWRQYMIMIINIGGTPATRELKKKLFITVTAES